MAKAKNPFFSLGACGAFGRALVYQDQRGHTTVQAFRRRPRRRTAAQLRSRAIMRTLRQNWSNFPESVRSYWNEQAKSFPNMTGYNLYIKHYFDEYMIEANHV